jgi:hypothetical protein
MTRFTRVSPQLSWTTLGICSWHAVETLHNFEYARSIVLHPAVDTLIMLAGVAAGIVLLHHNRTEALVRREPVPIPVVTRTTRPERQVVIEETIVVVWKKYIERSER